MLDFTHIEKAMMEDLKLICIDQYLIFNHLNILPKEVNLIIIYDRLCISDELVTLKDSIEYSYKEGLHLLLYLCVQQDLNIVSNYEKQLHSTKISSIYQPNRKSQSNHFIDKLYKSNNQIFNIIIAKYLFVGYMDREEYRNHYIVNMDWYNQQLTIPTKYKPLLQIKIL